MSDFLPIMGRKRVPYIWISAFMVSFAYFYLGTVPCGVGMYIFMMIVCDAWWVWSEVMVDTLIVEKIGANAPYSSSLQSLAFASCDFAAMLVAWAGGALLDHISPQQVFLISAALPAVCLAAAAVLREPRIPHARACAGGGGVSCAQAAGVLRRLGAVFATPLIWRSTLVMFLIQATPSYSAAMTYFYTNALGFQDDKEFFGRRDLVVTAADLVGVLLFQRFLRRLSIRRVLLVSTLVSAALQLSGILVATRANRALGIPDGFFLLGDNGAMGIVGTVQQLPMVFFAAKICPPGLESTLYATLMTVWDWAMPSAGLLKLRGAYLTDALGVTETEFGRFPTLIALCSLSTLLPLLLIRWVPDVVPASFDDPATPPAPASEPVAAGKRAAERPVAAPSPAESATSSEGFAEPLAHRLRRLAQGRRGLESAPLLRAPHGQEEPEPLEYGSGGESEGAGSSALCTAPATLRLPSP
eukprot:tig00021432_g21207.t1